MATSITTIQSTDLITNSRADINNNFDSLLVNKIETDVLTTDSTFTAASDSKIPSQLAVKQYVDAGGNVNASTTGKGIVEEATQAEVASLSAAGGTGARLFMNPSTACPVFGIKSVTAGATITGATLPVPVYQNKTDNEFYACDANDTAAMKFLGFAISNGADGAAMTVQFAGIVSGFTALDEGEKYYLSDTVGTISTTPGTYTVLVGVAISTTELLIQKGQRHAHGVSTFTASGWSGTGAISTETIGFRPSKIKIQVIYDDDLDSDSVGVWTEASSSYISKFVNGTTQYTYTQDATASDDVAKLTLDGSAFHTISITSVTDTGFTITNAESGTAFSGVCYILWEAEGEL